MPSAQPRQSEPATLGTMGEPRLGLPSDLDGVTQVIMDAMPLDPQWHYRFPYRKQFPEDHERFTRMLLEYFLDPDLDDWTVMVVEDTDPGDGEPRIVSFGVFDVSYKNKARYGPGYMVQDPVTLVEENGGRERRDANHERFMAFWDGQIAAYKRLFAKFGPNKIHLQILATHTQFQNRGHGSAICRWAMNLVDKERLANLSVMASPMGFKLYTWLGFERVDSFIIRVPGEETFLTLQAMMDRPKDRNGARKGMGNGR